MSQLFVVCELGLQSCRIFLGTFQSKEQKLQISELREFPNEPLQDRKAVYWNFGQIYQEIFESLQQIGGCEESVAAVTVTSWAGDYFFIDKEGELLPTPHPNDPEAAARRIKVLAKLSPESIYQHTGTQGMGRNLFLQLATEGRRLKGAQVLPVADGFNGLLSGQMHASLSMAGATQLLNPQTRQWSAEMLQEFQIPFEVLPGIVEDGKVLGPVPPNLAQVAGFEEAVVTAGSHQLVSALTALDACANTPWAFFTPGQATLLGTVVDTPVINHASRELGFTHLPMNQGYGLYGRTSGLWILHECQNFWEQQSRSMDAELLAHLAGAATPFEAFIDPSDPRFSKPGDMPLKVQAYCKQTNQPIPRKPGAIYRCVLESLALHYRKLCNEMAHLTGKRFGQIYLLSGGNANLLDSFIANALQVPVLRAPAHMSAIGCMLNQAKSVGLVKTTEEQRELVRRSFRFDRIQPHANTWDEPFQRFISLALEPEPVAA
jgi:sugar (pentulose or hexulose) kinase